MDIARMPADPAKFLETTASNAELADLAHKALSILRKRGAPGLVRTCSVGKFDLVDEVEDLHTEAISREPGGLDELLSPKAEPALASLT